MMAILGSRSLTDESFTTTMCLVEQTLNARPVTQQVMILLIWRPLRLIISIWDVLIFVYPLFSMPKFIPTIAKCLGCVKRIRIKLETMGCSIRNTKQCQNPLE